MTLPLYSFNQRQQDYLENKRRLETKMRAERQMEEMKECTFKPHLKSKSGRQSVSRGIHSQIYSNFRKI